ncbi:MAG: oligoendopeptidase F [Defluviitaleaceae bacterium]|nr:oligoendopeptidase F [Defluviitaleaceae bacterium]
MPELKTRDQIAPEFKWNLTTLYESDDAWQAAFDVAGAYADAIKANEGKLGASAENLLACLTQRYEISGHLSRLILYSHLKHDEDTANPVYQGMRDKARGLTTKLQAAASFITPEIIAIGEDAVNALAEGCDGLKVYRHYFHDLFREEKHVLSPDKEEIMAKASEIGDAAQSIYTMINNADMAFGKAVDSQGVEHEITHGQYGRLMESADRTLRKNTFDTYYAAYAAQKNTLAEAYNYSVKNDLFVADVRNYDSALDEALSGDNIPKEIYKNLVDSVNANLPLFHRYLALRKKCLGYDQLHMYDMRVPIVENADTFMDWENAKTAVVDGLAALGPDYQALVRLAFDSGWVDVYENKGKRSGAYCWGVYGAAHPYVLMNYNDTMGDMFTLAHEMGHALHSHFTHKTQPAPYGSYTIFLAEVASTVNEALVMEHLLNTTVDKTKYNYLLNYFIQQFVGTFFRQTMFAEFEMIAHEMAERGEPLNADSLGKLYRGLMDKHFGDGGVVLDDQINCEWSRIPHFYRAFYVYQYATGFAAAMAFAKKIREEGQSAVEKYLAFLASGSKDYSINLLKEAGLDMVSPQPINDAMKIFEDLLDRFDKANFN